MATKVLTRLVDDTDGSDAAETVHFSLDGQTFEIDLSVDNAAKLREALAPYIERGRKAAKDEGKRRKKQRGLHTQVIDSHAIRVWTEANGIKVGVKGRIPANVISRYQAAGN
jgi:Lsr2